MEFKNFKNPFLMATIIVIVLNIMVYFFFSPSVGKKTYFRSIFYMWITTMIFMYIHNMAIMEEYKDKLNENLNLDLVNRTGSEFEIKPDIKNNEVEGRGETNEDELI